MSEVVPERPFPPRRQGCTCIHQLRPVPPTTPGTTKKWRGTSRITDPECEVHDE